MTTATPNGLTGPVDQLNRALSATAELIAGVRDNQWTAPIPCAGWTARELVNTW